MKATLLVAFGLSLATVARADFDYPTFNDTSGLFFLGSAATSSCKGGEIHPYQPRHGTADGTGRIPGLIKEDAVAVTAYETITNIPEESDYITNTVSVLGHRREFGSSPDPSGCPLRARLTPSQPYKVGAMWHQAPIPITSGWETGFSFQISEHSRVCRRVKDRDFSTRLYESCIVHGGDGFAFVIHNDKNRTAALGVGGERMGYTGISNAVAVEFDTWYNPDIGDLFYDHVTIQASGPAGSLVSNASQTMGAARPTSLADGEVHNVKIQYFNHLKYDLLVHFSATRELVPYLKDAGESRRLGTIVVYVDDMDEPLTAIPFNMHVAMRLQEGQAYIGFTSATGKAWERHDLLSWYFCEAPGCPRSGLGPVEWQSQLDFMSSDEIN